MSNAARQEEELYAEAAAIDVTAAVISLRGGKHDEGAIGTLNELFGGPKPLGGAWCDA